MKYFTEIEKLAEGLNDRNMKYELHPLFKGWQIVCGDWDVICHEFSYGGEADLLEAMGREIVRVEYDEVEGYLTAEEILRRLDKKSA